MKIQKIVPFVLLVGGLFAGTAKSAEVVWFSTSNTDPGSAPAGGVNTITYNSLGSKTLYIWVTDGTPVTPTNAYPPQGGSPTPWPIFVPPTSAFFSYSLGVSGVNVAAISLNAGSISNPNILNASGIPFTADTDWSGTVGASEFVTRWDSASNFTLAANPTFVTASSITDLNANTLPIAIDTAGAVSGIMTNIHAGLSTSPNDSYLGTQPGYNAVSHTFLLGQVSFDANSFNTDGSTILGLGNSTFGIGTGSQTYNTNTHQWTGVFTDLSGNFTLGQATIDIVPEPATWLLLLSGGLGTFFFRKTAKSRLP